MLRSSFQVFRYGLQVLALVSGFLLLAFLLWPYAKLQPLFRQFEAEKDWLLPWNSFSGHYGFGKTAYVVAKCGLGFIFFSALFGLYSLSSGTFSAFLRTLFPGKTIAFFWQKLVRTWLALPRAEKWLAGLSFGLLVAVRVYFLFTMRIGQDETASYMLFLNKGLPAIIFYYPLPNNHIFYNLLCLPLRYLFSDPYWVMQLPAFVISIAGTAVIYLALRSSLPFAVTFLTVCGFSFSQLALFYAVHGRGYFLVTVCGALAAIALIKILERKEAIYWLVFLVCSVAGFYTVPVFLYPFGALLLFAGLTLGLTRDWQNLGNLAVVTFFAGFATVLLYAPVLMGSGPKLLLFNDYVSRYPAGTFFRYLPNKVFNLQGVVLGQERIGFYLWLLAVAGLAILLVLPRLFKALFRKAGLAPAWVFLALCGSVLPWGMLVLQRVLPPDRVFFFKAFFDFLAIGLVVYLLGYFFLKNRAFWWYSVAICFLLVYGAYETGKQIRTENSVAVLDKGFDKRLEAIRQTGARTIFANEIYYSGNLRYYYFKQNVPGFTIDEFRFLPSRNYDLLILSRQMAAVPGLQLSAYRLWYQDAFVQIYLRQPANL